MSSSRFKFLLDENVRIELYEFLRTKKVDVSLAPKGLSNGRLASRSLEEGRVLVTNDEDFTILLASEVFAVILLKIPQDDPEALVEAFSRFISAEKSLKGRLVTLWENRFDVASLAEERSTK